MLYTGSLTTYPAQTALLLISLPMTDLMEEREAGISAFVVSLMQIGECEISPQLLGGSPLYLPPPHRWVCDGETQRYILTVSQS